MDTYVQAVTDEKREAQNKVVKMLLPGRAKLMADASRPNWVQLPKRVAVRIAES